MNNFLRFASEHRHVLRISCLQVAAVSQVGQMQMVHQFHPVAGLPNQLLQLASSVSAQVLGWGETYLTSLAVVCRTKVTFTCHQSPRLRQEQLDSCLFRTVERL
jgi:hypothetical protein